MAIKVRKTEHAGAKNGGGHWGNRAEAKSESSRRRRQESKQIVVREQSLTNQLSELTASVCKEIDRPLNK